MKANHEKLRALREERGLSRESVVSGLRMMKNPVSISLSTLVRAETGRSAKPGPDFMYALAAFYGVDVLDLWES